MRAPRFVLEGITLAATCAALAGAAAAQTPDAPSTQSNFAFAIDTAQARVAKVYGATIGREPGYASGVVVSADGQIVTALSVLLEAQSVRVVLADGRSLAATVVKRDETRQLALLKIATDNLAYFDLDAAGELRPGDWLIAAANPFKVAVGPEPVSVSLGVYAGQTRLAARRRAQDFPYTGPVLLTDVLIATPGSAGGALVDTQGRLVGVIGRAVVSNLTNTWINYALPVAEVRAFVRDEATSQPAVAGAETPTGPPDLGIRVFNVGGRSRPAYVERVRPGSPARAAGLRADDLILSINGVRVASCEEYDRAVAALAAGAPVELTFKRGEAVMTVELKPAGAP